MLLCVAASLLVLAEDPDPDPVPAVQHTITSNLQYRLTRGDLPDLAFGLEKPKNVEVIAGGEELLKSCLSNAATWSQDSLIFRLAHTHPAAIQSCRENNSPSIHAIFRKVADEPLRAWVHLDGHGAQTSGSRILHLGEFLYHKIRLQTNDQERMFENLQRSFSNPSPPPSAAAVPFTIHQRFSLFTSKTLTRVQPYASSVVSSAFTQMFSPSDVWGQGSDRFTNHLVASFTQRLVRNGLQGAAAAALHEDLRYKPSHSDNLWKRASHALVSTVVLETSRGGDLAFANIVSAFGSGIILSTYHPGRDDLNHPGTWSLAGWNFVGFAQSNLWNEFKPDIKHLVRTKLLRRK